MNKTLAALSIAAISFIVTPSVGFAEASELYKNNCSACHGASGEGNVALKAPVLAGYSEDYLTRQTKHFVAGTRTGEDPMGMIAAMVAIQKKLSEDDIKEISSYLSSLDVPTLEQEVKPIGFRERGLYSGCSSCHEATAEGNEALGAPRLTGQYSWYLKAQLLGFRGDHRGTDKEDTYGIQMKAMATAIASEDDIDTLVNYLLTLEAK